MRSFFISAQHRRKKSKNITTVNFLFENERMPTRTDLENFIIDKHNTENVMILAISEMLNSDAEIFFELKQKS